MPSLMLLKAEVDIFGRLLLALLITAESGKRLWTNWDSLSPTRTITTYGIWKAMLDELREVVLETKNWSLLEWSRKLKILKQRKRKRKLQRIEKKVLNKLKWPAPVDIISKDNETGCLPA